MINKIQYQQLNLSSCWKWKARAEFYCFEPLYCLYINERCEGSPSAAI